MGIADIWAQRPNVTLLEKLNIKDNLEEEIVLVAVEDEGERDVGSQPYLRKPCDERERMQMA